MVDDKYSTVAFGKSPNTFHVAFKPDDWEAIESVYTVGKVLSLEMWPIGQDMHADTQTLNTMGTVSLSLFDFAWFSSFRNQKQNLESQSRTRKESPSRKKRTKKKKLSSSSKENKRKRSFLHLCLVLFFFFFHFFLLRKIK